MIPNINGFTTITGITNLTSKDFIDDATIFLLRISSGISKSHI